MEPHERLSLGYIDSAAPLNMELPQTGMNEDIKHLQNRIRDLEKKIKQDNQELNEQSPRGGPHLMNNDVNISFHSTTKKGDVIRDQQSEITINNIELEQIAQKQDKFGLLKNQFQEPADQSSADFQKQAKFSKSRSKKKIKFKQQMAESDDYILSNVYKNQLESQRHRQRKQNDENQIMSSSDTSQDADENESYSRREFSKLHSRLTPDLDAGQNEDNSSIEQIDKDEDANIQRYIQSDLDQ